MKQNRVIYIVIVLFILVIAVYYFRSNNRITKENNGARCEKPVQGLDRNVDEFVITKHAKCRMECRDVTKEEIKAVLRKGIINKSKTDLHDKRGPSYAIDGYGDNRQHLRIVFAPREKKLVVVTCIDLDKEWQCDCN